MSLVFFLPVFLLVLLLLLVFLWSTGPARKTPFPYATGTEELGRRHVTHCAQIRQALSREDFAYLASAGGLHLARKVRKERHQIARAYLAGLRSDFRRLVRLGKVIAKLSPELVALQEFERLTLTAQFFWRCRVIELRLLLGMAPLANLVSASELVSLLAVRVEAALKEMGERAAVAVEMASSVDRRLNTV